jgi:hypothetical protein
MPARLRSFVVALTIAALLGTTAAPAFAQSFGAQDDTSAYQSSVPMVFDVLLLRPIGLTMLVGGTALYGLFVLPITALTRPTEIWKPALPLIVAPAKFTFSDPLGQHPVK